MMLGTASMLASLAFGQKDSVQTAVLNDVIITANKLEQKQSSTGKVVSVITKEQIEEAHERIKPFIHHTPVFSSTTLNEISGAFIFFKCENLLLLPLMNYQALR